MKQLYLFKLTRKFKQLAAKGKRRKKKKRDLEPSNIMCCRRCERRLDAERVPMVNAICAFCWRPDEVAGGFNRFFVDHFHALEPLDKDGDVREYGELVCHHQQADRCARIVKRYVQAEYRNRTVDILRGLDKISLAGPQQKVLAAWRARIRPQIEQMVRDNEHRASLFNKGRSSVD